MDLIQAIVYGIVQGLTEFLPISSTAHLRIVPSFLGWSDPGAAFTAVIQLGTLFAVLIYFWSDLVRAFSGWLRSLRGGEAAKAPEARLGWAILVGTIPIVVFGLLFKDEIKGATLRSLYTIAFALIIMGALLWIAERAGARKRQVENAGVLDGLIVGLWQAVALVPGASRSGSTITGALFMGFDRAAAARFSFLLSVPSIFAAGILELAEEWDLIVRTNLLPSIVATIVSFVVGYWSIGFLIRFLERRSVAFFVAYRIALGCLLLVLLKSGVLSPQEGAAHDQRAYVTQNR